VGRIQRNAIVVGSRTVTQTTNANVVDHSQQELLSVRVVRWWGADALHKPEDHVPRTAPGHATNTKKERETDRQREGQRETPDGERENTVECSMCNVCVSTPLSQSRKEHCNERYTTLISARTYLTEVPDSIHAVPSSSRLFCSQTTTNCRAHCEWELFPTMDEDWQKFWVPCDRGRGKMGAVTSGMGLSDMSGLSAFLRKTAFKRILIEACDRRSACCELSVFSRRG